MAGDPRPDPKVIGAYLDDVEAELDAFDALFARQNRLSVYHLQQAAEKLVRAVRLHRGLINTKDHNLAILVDGPERPNARQPEPLPEGDPWRPRILDLDWLSAYATAFRYPTTSGRRDPGPSKERLEQARKALTQLLSFARSELLAETR